MKKFVLFLLTALYLPSLALAEGSSHSAKLRLGVHSTSVTSKASGVSFSSRTGFHLGANALIPVASQFEFMPGLSYVSRSVSYSVLGITIIPTVTYLDLEAFGKFNINESFNIFGGPFYAMKSSDSCEVEGIAGTCTLTDVKSSYMGLAVGVGIVFGSLGLDLFMKKGFGDVWGSSTAGGKDATDIGASFAIYL